ncbi:hypothetical protein [Arvimicrobium flavum]|nr:hypothetical protein [Mesorhizobium shangrilense]
MNIAAPQRFNTEERRVLDVGGGVALIVTETSFIGFLVLAGIYYLGHA